MNYQDLYENVILANDVDKLRELISSGLVNVKGRDENGDNYLHVAVREKKVEILKLLLRHLRRDIHQQRSRDGLTPLEVAVQTSQLRAARLLLKHGANPEVEVSEIIDNEYAVYRRCALDFALDNEDSDMIKLLLSYGAEHSKEGCLSLVFRNSTIMSDPELREFFVEHSTVDVFFKDEHGRDALYDALLYAELEYVEQLLAMDLSAKQVDKDGRAPLHHLLCYACGWDGDDMAARIQLLVDHGADVNAFAAKENATPLYFAASHGSSKPVKRLLKLGARIDRGVSPLLGAIKCAPTLDAFDFLIDKGADVNCLQGGQSLLNHAIRLLNEWGNFRRESILVQMVKVLVEKGLKRNDGRNSQIANDEIRRIVDTYEETREKMRITRVCDDDDDASVTYLDLLLKRGHGLAKCLRNAKVCEIVDSDRYKIMFPVFSHRLEQNLSRGFKRIGLNDDAVKVLCDIFTRIPNEVINMILAYLDDDEIDTLLLTAS